MEESILIFIAWAQCLSSRIILMKPNWKKFGQMPHRYTHSEWRGARIRLNKFQLDNFSDTEITTVNEYTAREPRNKSTRERGRERINKRTHGWHYSNFVWCLRPVDIEWWILFHLTAHLSILNIEPEQQYQQQQKKNWWQMSNGNYLKMHVKWDNW